MAKTGWIPNNSKAKTDVIAATDTRRLKLRECNDVAFIFLSMPIGHWMRALSSALRILES